MGVDGVGVYNACMRHTRILSTLIAVGTITTITGCGSPSPAATRTAAAQLLRNYDGEVKPLAERGIAAQVDAGEIQPATADVLRETLARHRALIEQLANPDRSIRR